MTCGAPPARSSCREGASRPPLGWRSTTCSGPGRSRRPRANCLQNTHFEGDPNNVTRFVPGFTENAVDLQYGYLEGRRVFGFLQFRLGRQYLTDTLGWTSFDGGLVRVAVPALPLAIEAEGGLEA